jgi:hypothetical protein
VSEKSLQPHLSLDGGKNDRFLGIIGSDFILLYLKILFTGLRHSHPRNRVSTSLNQRFFYLIWGLQRLFW